MEPTVILFAIESGVKLGRKTYQVLLDETRERPLFLPLGDLFGDVKEATARIFFAREENRFLVEEGGPYAGLSGKALVDAYRTILGINEQLGNVGSVADEAVDTVRQLHAFEQHKNGYGSNPPVQRLLGTMVEVGMDYFSANSQAIGRNSSARQLIHAFVAGLDEVDFAENELADIAGEVLLAGLKVFGQNTSLVSSDERIQILLGGVTGALIDHFASLQSELSKIIGRNYFQRATGSILSGTAKAAAENGNLFSVGNGARKNLVRTILRQILTGLSGQEDLLTNDALETLIQTALVTAAESPELFSGSPIVQDLIEKTLETFAARPINAILSPASLVPLLQIALETFKENIPSLLDPNGRHGQYIADGIAAMAHGLAMGRKPGRLFSTGQITDLAEIVFNEISKYPEKMFEGIEGGPKQTLLAQSIASLMAALGEDPFRHLSSRGLLDLIALVLQVSAQNADKLIDTRSQDPGTNLLHVLLRELTAAVEDGHDARKLFSREVFLETARRVVPIASSNVEPFLNGKAQLIYRSVQLALHLAHGKFQNRINGDTLPKIIETLLTRMMAEEHFTEDAKMVESAVDMALRSL